MSATGDPPPGLGPRPQNSSQASSAPSRVNHPPGSSTTEVPKIPSINIAEHTRTSTVPTNHPSSSKNLPSDPMVTQLRQGMESLSLYERSDKSKAASSASTSLPSSGLAFTLRSSSLGRTTPSIDRDDRKNPKASPSQSAGNLGHFSASDSASEKASVMQLPSHHGPSGDVHPEKKMTQGSDTTTTSKKSALGGDLTASKYATEAFVPAATSREPSTFNLFSERVTPPVGSQRSRKLPKASRSSKASSPQASSRSPTPTQSSGPPLSAEPPIQIGHGQRQWGPTPPRDPASFQSSYHQSQWQPHRLSEMPSFTGSGLQTGSRLQENTAFGHGLSKQASTPARAPKNPASQTFVPPQPAVQPHILPTSQTQPLNPGKDAMTDLIPPPQSHSGRFQRSPVPGTTVRDPMQAQADKVKKALDDWAHGRKSDSGDPNAAQTPKEAAKSDKTRAKVDAISHVQNQQTKTPRSVLRPTPAIKDEKSEQVQVEGPDQSSASSPGNASRSPDSSKIRLRINYGNELKNTLYGKWAEHIKATMDLLDSEQRDRMAELQSTLVTAMDEQLRLLGAEQARYFKERDMALKLELAKLREDQMSTYYKKRDALTAEMSQAHRERAAQFKIEWDYACNALKDEAKTMNERLEAGIQRYVDELGSKEGMEGMAKRLFPGAEHGDPADDLVVHHKRPTAQRSEKPVIGPMPDNEQNKTPAPSSDLAPSSIPTMPSERNSVEESRHSNVAGSTTSDGSYGTVEKQPMSPVTETGGHKSGGTSMQGEADEKSLDHGIVDGVRKVQLLNLPADASAKTVASLVWGGELEAIELVAASRKAEVLFICPADCAAYVKAAGAHIRFRPEAQAPVHWIFVHVENGADAVTPELQSYVEDGMTRCLQIEGLRVEWKIEAVIEKCAMLANSAVEHVYETRGEDDKRIVRIRLCKIQDAVCLMGELVCNSEFGHPNVFFSEDPCACATGVHYD